MRLFLLDALLKQVAWKMRFPDLDMHAVYWKMESIAKTIFIAAQNIQYVIGVVHLPGVHV